MGVQCRQEAFKAYELYSSSSFCVKEGQAEAARWQRDHGWGRLHRKSYIQAAYPGLPWELQENLCLLPYPPWPLLKKLNIVLTLKVFYLKEFHYWREYIEGWLQSWGSKLITDTIYGFKEENDIKFPNDQELIASLKQMIRSLVHL